MKDFSNFKKVKEDASTVTLKHPQGHAIKIMKGALSPKMRGQMAALPLYAADGTEDPVADPTANLPQSSSATDASQPQAPVTINVGGATPAPTPPADEPLTTHIGRLIGQYGVQPLVQGVKDAIGGAEAVGSGAMNVARGVMAGSTGDGTQPVNAATPNAPQAPASPPPAPSNFNLGNSAPQGPVNQSPGVAPLSMSGYQQQIKGYQNAAAAQGKIDAAQAGIYGAASAQNQTTINDLQKAATDSLGHYQTEIDGTLADMKNGHIDPQHYVNNLGTGSKVANAIGLMLGGLSGGMNHSGVNPALEMLNANIARDVAAQQASFNNKLAGHKTLLEAYQNQFNDSTSAAKMTQAVYTQKMVNDINQAAVAQGTDVAKARALQLTGPLTQQMNQLKYDVGLRQAAMNAGQGMDPSQQLQLKSMAGLIPADQRGPVSKEIDRLQTNQKAQEGLMANFDQATQENTIANRAAHAGFEPASVSNLRNSMMPMLKDAEGRVNETEMHNVESYIPQPGDLPAKVAERRAGLNQFISLKNQSSLLKSYGITMPAPAPVFRKRN